MAAHVSGRIPDQGRLVSGCGLGRSEITAPHNRPLIYIVTVDYRSRDDTLAALRSFARTDYPHFEIMLVDNGSGDDTIAAVQAEMPRVQILASETNLGFAGGYNLGIAQALAKGAEAVLVINNDVAAPPEMLAQLVPHLRGQVGAVSPVIYYDSRPDIVWSSGFKRHPLTLEMRAGRRGQRAESSDRAPYPVDYLLGCAVLMSRTAIETAGAFDTRYFLYYEDLDLSLIRHQREHGSVMNWQDRRADLYQLRYQGDGGEVET